MHLFYCRYHVYLQPVTSVGNGLVEWVAVAAVKQRATADMSTLVICKPHEPRLAP